MQSSKKTAPGLRLGQIITQVNHWSVAWPLAVILLTIGTPLLWIPYLDVPLDVDAGGYATAAYWWARGDTLYREIAITRPQGIFVVFRLIELAGLGTVRGIHLVGAVTTALCSLTLLTIGARLWGRAIAFGASLIFSIVMATPHLMGYTVNADLFMALPLLGSIYLLIRADRHAPLTRQGLVLLAGCGFLGAKALLLKPSGFAAPLLAALWLLYRWREERWGATIWLRAQLALTFGFLGGIIPAILHGMYTVPELYLDTVLFNRLGQDSALAMGFGYQLYRFVNNSVAILMHLPILLMVPIGIYAAQRREERRQYHLLCLWLITAFAGAALGSNWFLHYYQQLLPPLAIATALGIRRLARSRRGIAVAAGQGLALVGIGALAFSMVTLLMPPADPDRLLLDYTPEKAVSGPIAAYLRAHTAPDERIYVAYDQAVIYYLAERRPAARWLYFRELQWTPGAFAEQVARIANPATAPQYIVGAQPFDEFGLDADGQLRAIVERDYALETTIGGIPIYVRK